jgi:hypothetical protein
MLLTLLLATGCAPEVSQGASKAADVAPCEGGPTLAEGWEAALEADGCGWYIRAVKPTGVNRLIFDIPEFLDARDGEPVDVTYSLPDDAVRFRVEVGCTFDLDECPSEDTDSALDTYDPTSGTAVVRATPADGGADVTLELADVTLVSRLGVVIPMEPLTLSTFLHDEP